MTRKAQKAASRSRVLEAARSLFEEVGFQETTVKMIAERAGLSPAGVFTTFEDKVGILFQIITDKSETLFREVEEAAKTCEGDTRDRLVAVLDQIYAYDASRLPMVMAFLGASFSWSAALEEEYRKFMPRLRRVIDDVIAEGAKRGEIAPGADRNLLADMISANFLANVRTAYFDGLDARALSKLTRVQLDALFDGFGPRA